jgi:uncharacterized protein (TIGR04255 family)
MVEIRYLKNAPITEAIIDFRVQPLPHFDVRAFEKVTDRLAKEFPKREERKVWEGRIQVKPGISVSQSPKPEQVAGFAFKSADGLTIAQFRLDGFTFNRLKPYTRWEQLFPKAWELWSLYTEVGVADFIKRIAVRYINKLDLPAPVSSLEQYLTSPPRAPEGTRGRITSFLNRVVMNTEDGLAANITQALEKSGDNGSVVILDIDAYKRQDFEIRDDKVQEVLKALRTFKNEIFFNSLTEKTVRLFE